MASTAGHYKDSTIASRKISWPEFEKRYLTREDKYKYEWLNGIVEKTERSMNQEQFYIVRNLFSFFRKLIVAGKLSGELMTEGDAFFLENHRKPDIAYYTDEQIDRAAYGENQVPQFVIEVISKNDKINKNQRKLQDYYKAGVQVIWEIFPELEQVNEYHGADMSMKTKKEEDLCSAAPVLPEFAMTVNAIFQKPQLANQI